MLAFRDLKKMTFSEKLRKSFCPSQDGILAPQAPKHGRRIWKARQIADFRHWEFHVFFDQKVNSPKRVFFLHWKVEGYFFNFPLSEKWEFWKFNKGFFLCFDHFLVCWRFTVTFLVAGRLRRNYVNPWISWNFAGVNNHFPKNEGGFSDQKSTISILSRSGWFFAPVTLWSCDNSSLELRQ